MSDSFRDEPERGNVSGPRAHNRRRAALLGLLLIFLVACAGAEESSGPSELEIKLTQEAGAPADEQAAAPEQTAAPPTEAPAAQSDTADTPTAEAPQPEAATATPNPELEAAIANATQTAEAIALTVDAAVEAESATQTAEAVALAPIYEELRALGIDPAQGQLGFTHPPISLQADEFGSYAFDNRDAITVAQDFVMAADITWESRFAESGCGFVVRSDGNEDALNQYIIGLTRGAQGHVLFAEQRNGDVNLDDVTDIYANGIDPRFEWQSNTTNRLAVVGRGQQFDIYSNGTYLGTINAISGFEEGFVAFIAVNRSGGIRCDYNNAYLWKLE